MVASNLQSKLNSLVVRAARGQPEMLDVLQEIINEIERLGIVVDPPPIAPNRVVGGDVAIVPEAPLNFRYILTKQNVILQWDPPSSDFQYYELRKGTSWNTAEKILTTPELQVILPPLLVGEHTFLLKSLSVDGVYNTTTSEVTIVIPELGSVTINPSVIDQNVLLYWNEPTSTFEIDYYKVLKNGEEFYEIDGTFAAIVELVKGNYIYTVIPVDIAGNIGPSSHIQVEVTGPPDFVLRDEFISTLTGEKVNAYVENMGLLLPIYVGVHTWAQHFTLRNWDSPQDQVDAGYPYYIQPGTIVASYKEVFDVGLVYPATIITITYSATVIVPAFTVGVSTRVSDDGVNWSPSQLGNSIFVESVKFIEVTLNFTGSSDKSLMFFHNLHVSLSVKQVMDSGSILALAADPIGTFVAFNVPFKDIDSITLTTKSTKEEYHEIFDFNDEPNPIGFSVYVYDTTGIRVTKEVEWKARGIR